ncbi:NTE family protein [Rhizomicrobium palustre]|uniref:NTE family protein n=1 Tax=Rhizomicrobium palustre TaxID=189966 RepID=A0A846MW05_9PROT|nr:patatin-like phospholipase family protein [Rhizomicrobium palustre]NIK87341.1 NTE family protein [Rhizomicrobium palustre]
MLPFLSALRLSESLLDRFLAEKLSGFPLFDGLSISALRRLAPFVVWFGLPGGSRLCRQGGEEGALLMVLTGTIGIFRDVGEEKRRLAAELSPGAVVADPAFDRSVDLIALRDSELIELTPAALEILAVKKPRLFLEVMKETAARGAAKPVRSRPKTFALVPLQEGLSAHPIAERLAMALDDMGALTGVVDASAAGRQAEWFANFESAHDAVFYRGDVPDSAWTRLCIRQADRVLVIATVDRPLPRKPLLGGKERVCGLPELILLHPSGVPRDAVILGERVETHHHIRENRPDDIRRLARCISGRAVGLVLGGGGARGFGHIGVVKALAEAGVPFDYLGGVSMGAIIAAGLAAEWSIEELTVRLRESFVRRNPLSDYTLPLISLVKGRRMSKLLTRHFGRVRIEDLPKPFFCISADLTTGHVHEHLQGPLWRALRSSAALPGIVPPVTSRGHLLVDGGVMNNLPVDVMRRRRIGPLLASDVTGENDFSVRDTRYGEHHSLKLIWQRMRGMPSIFDILMRTGTMGSEAQRRLVRDEADFLFEPPLAGINPLDWKSFDRAIAEGYDHARAMIDRHGLPLTDRWSDGPAVVKR